MKVKQILYSIIIALGLIWTPTLHATDGTWTSLTSGNWSTPGNWSGNNVANGTGASAWFSTLNLPADVTVTLDVNPSLGFLQFGNGVTNVRNWTLTGNNLLLQTSTGVPVIDVTNNVYNQTATINSTVIDTQGLNKTGAGTLVLGAANTFVGGTLSNLAGYVQLNNANALSGLANVLVTNLATLTLPSGVTYANVPAVLSGNGPSGFGRGAMYYTGAAGGCTWPGVITLNGATTIGNYGASGGYTLPNVIGGTGPLTLWAGGGATNHVLTVNLNTNETYTGNTVFNATFGSSEVVNLNASSNTLPTSTALAIVDNWNANYVTVNLAGHNQTLTNYQVNGGATATNNLTSSSGMPTLTLSSTTGGSNDTLMVNGGTLNINNVIVNVGGVHTTAYDHTTDFGAGATATTINISNATVNGSFYTDLGRSAHTVMNVNNGGALNNLVGGEILMSYGNANSASTLNINSGGSVTAHFIRAGNGGAGGAGATINLNTNGLLVVDEIYSQNTNLFNFNGGVLRVNTSPTTPWIAASMTNVYIQPGGAIIDTAGRNATLAPSLFSTNGSGSLTKMGAGILTLTANSHTYVGSTVVSNGVLAVDGTLTASAVLVPTPDSGTTNALGGTGTVATVTVNLGGSVNPGRVGTAGTLNINTLTCNSGSYLQFDLSDPSQVGAGVNDLLSVGSFTAASPTYLSPNFPGGTPVVGRYEVATYTSAGGLPNLAIDPLWAGSRAAPGLDASTPGQIAIVITNATGPNTALYWWGNNPNQNWDLNVTTNWAFGNDSFYSGDGVIFDDNGQTGVVNLVTALVPGSVTFNNGFAYTLGGSGKITGTAGLTLNGSAPVILATDNDYTGGTTLSGAASTLQIGNAGTHGNVGPGDILFTSTATGASVAYNRTDPLTLNNRITGGPGYQPSMVVNSGTLTLGGATDNPYAVATVNGGTLVLAKTSTTLVHALGGTNAALTVNTGGTAKLGGTGGDQISDARDVQLSGGTFDLGGMNETVGQFNGYGAITNSGSAATLTLGGSANANGALYAAGGTLSLQGGTVTVAGTWNQHFGVAGGATFDMAGGTLNSGSYFGVGNGYGAGTANMVARGGTFTSTSELLVGFQKPAVVTINNGATLNLNWYSWGDGTVYYTTNWFNGGTIMLAKFNNRGPSPATLYFNGTLFQAKSTQNPFLLAATNITANVTTNGAIFDSQGYNITVNSSLLHDPALGAVADGGLTKSAGSGTLILAGTNTYAGPTLVSAGTLQVNGILGTNTLTVATNATLNGNGVILGAVAVHAGGTLAPGGSIGVLTVSNTLTLNATSTNVFEISSSLGTNDQVRGISTVTYGGTLIVTNLAGGTISSPISFKLFDATTYNPAQFASIQWPAVGAGLVWTNMLNQNGTIAVVSAAPASSAPNFTTVGLLPDRNFSMTVTGATGTAWSLRATNNVAAPLTNWPVIQSGTISTSPFTLNDLDATNHARRFYRFSAP